MDLCNFIVRRMQTIIPGSLAAMSGSEDSVIMVNDVARAFFEAPAKRSICIELPDEDKSEEDQFYEMFNKELE